MQENFCLTWNDFKENTISSFGNLREEAEFADVTLVCKDGQLVEAHKLVLAASSPIFRNMLKTNKQAHPLIYFSGMNMDNLTAVLDFMYCGEANVPQKNLELFLGIGEELLIKGLVGNSGAAQELQTKSADKIVKKGDNCLQACDSYLDQVATANNDTVLFSGNLQELDEKCNSMMERTSRRKDNGQSLFKCKLCGKEEICGGMKHHIEANHLQGVSIPCNFCEKKFPTRNSLANHIHASHRAFKQSLKQLRKQ